METYIRQKAFAGTEATQYWIWNNVDAKVWDKLKKDELSQIWEQGGRQVWNQIRERA